MTLMLAAPGLAVILWEGVSPAPACARCADDVSVVVVTLNALPWVERCLESVRGHDMIVVDHGSTDGTLELVRERFPEVRVIEQENRGMGGETTRACAPRRPLLLPAQLRRLGGRRRVERLVAFADAHPEVALAGPRLLTPTGRCSARCAAFPTIWRLATEYLFIRKLARARALLNPLYAGGFEHD